MVPTSSFGSVYIVFSTARMKQATLPLYLMNRFKGPGIKGQSLPC